MYLFVVFVGLFSCYSCQDAINVPVSTGSRACTNKDVYAVCNIVPNPHTPSFINGTIYFMQQMDGKCGYGFLSIQVNIDNVPIDDGTNKHGIHVHEYGDMTNGCESMGGHYNPHGSTHGFPWNPPNSRHVGDLGNVSQRGKEGSIKTRIVDYLASLHGPLSIIGRGIVLHAGKDDLGLNPKHPDSLKTGNAGGRLACCVIGRSARIDRSMFSLYG